MLTSQQIRWMFLDFFKIKNHKILNSFSIIRKNDPTLMFTNSGMNYFKDIFIGKDTSKYKRIANCQKCLRVSGKHNDLNDVGYDTYHHTMFEMLGNWSFSDYFKAESIEWAWNLLINVYKIPEKNIYVTIFKGNLDNNYLYEDLESFNIWNNFINKDKILFFDKKYNFWEMGDTGPCGISTEIHVDLRCDKEQKIINGRDLVNTGHPDVIELWNIVFVNFYRNSNNKLNKLFNFYVDTGIGFERLCRIIQKKSSNYDTDLFLPIINKMELILNIKYGVNSKSDIAIRIVADHIRAITFSISDGQLPSNHGPGYVIRRIIRRAISYAYKYLNQRNPFLYQLIGSCVFVMRDYYPNLHKQYDLICETVNKEEKLFLKTLHKGIKKINKIIYNIKNSGKDIIGGSDLFLLYDTYGFPLDISLIFALENNLRIDEKGFDDNMKKHKLLSKK